jgi:predicted phosphoribosyltransferase
MGAIASGGIMVLNDDVIQGRRISREALDTGIAREREELARRDRLYRDKRPTPNPAGRTVILVDDGLATGATMRAAVAALRQRRPARVVVAVPVAAAEAAALLAREADEVVCPLVPSPFYGVGDWYRNFIQTSDGEVKLLLSRAWSSQPVGR